MEKCSRALASAMLVCFALLFALALLLGACRPAHLSYPAAFAVAVGLAALYALWLKRVHAGPSLWERIGEHATAAVLLAGCFLVNLAWVVIVRLEPSEENTAVWWNTALELATGEAVMNRGYVALFPHVLGYSSFLGLLLRVFGTKVAVAQVANVFLTTLSGFFLFRLALRYRGLNSAAFVLLLWSLFPSKLLYNAMVIAEPWYTCLVLAVLWLCSLVEGGRSLAWALLGVPAGLLLRLLNAARPIAAVPILALLIWVLLLRGERNKRSTRRLLGYTALLLAVYWLSGPVWNGFVRDTLGEEPSAFPGYSFYVGANNDSLGSYSAKDMALLEYYRFGIADSSAEVAQSRMMDEARERLNAMGPEAIRLGLYKLRTLLGNDEGGAMDTAYGLRSEVSRSLAIYSNIWYYLLGILALWGVWRLFRLKERRAILLAPLYVIGLTLAQLLVEVAPRFHYSMIPMLLLLAAFSYSRQTKEEYDQATANVAINHIESF